MIFLNDTSVINLINTTLKFVTNIITSLTSHVLYPIWILASQNQYMYTYLISIYLSIYLFVV